MQGEAGRGRRTGACPLDAVVPAHRSTDRKENTIPSETHLSTLFAAQAAKIRILLSVDMMSAPKALWQPNGQRHRLRIGGGLEPSTEVENDYDGFSAKLPSLHHHSRDHRPAVDPHPGVGVYPKAQR